MDDVNVNLCLKTCDLLWFAVLLPSGVMKSNEKSLRLRRLETILS